ncbi:hypothetical protein [Streptomyces sp. G1]|uniref:hypothetical protein n=1 Tax=Streptomyces sp. G1 TaxID=361572 RepID=UPI00202F8CAC|nr:hypothetical protein [Streptomyces sp. G1]MCM1964818.1 hypothetical protein [Streptomyces sp. G1]
MLPAGNIWDAVKVPSMYGLAVADPDALTAVAVAGPSHHDPMSGSVYFLVPPGSGGEWPPGTEYLGEATWVCTPAVDVRKGERKRPYWVQAPDGSGALVDPDELRAALDAAVAGAGMVA